MQVSQESVETGFAAGQPEALEQAFRMWGAVIYTLALRGVGDKNAAATVTKDTFLAVWHKGYEPSEGSLKTRLEVTCRALVHLYQRQDTAEASQPAEVDAAIDRVVVRDELTGMAEPERSIVRLSIQNNASVADLAQKFELTPEAVRLHMLLGVQQLRKQLQGSRHGH